MSSTPSLLPVISITDSQPPRPPHHTLSHVLVSPQDSHPSNPRHIRPWSIPLHLHKDDILAVDPPIPPLGWLRPDVRAFLEYHYPVSEVGEPFILVSIARSLGPTPVGNTHQDGPEYAYFSEAALSEGYEGLTRRMDGLARWLRKEGKWQECLGGWREEKYEIYGDGRSEYFKSQSGESSSRASNRAFDLERAACAIFGMATFGVHMTAYEGDGEDMQIWVPKRSATKATWPSKLDNSVAGGIPAGMTPSDSLIKECQEEASLPEGLTRRLVRSVGACMYFYTTEMGWFQPEIEYVYDLKLPAREDPEYTRLKPFDDEVDSFQLLPVSQVLSLLQTSPPPFKLNCALILVDFLIRHGIVKPETEPNYVQIVGRCHRDLEGEGVVAMPRRG